MASTTSGDVLPTGARIFISVPDLFFIPEWVIGGLVWILVASTRVFPDNPLGWVMFVSIFCFVGTTLWLLIFACGGNQNLFVFQVKCTEHSSNPLLIIQLLQASGGLFSRSELQDCTFQSKINKATPNVMSHVATLLYFLHAIFSAIRWKRA
uniref:Myelin and lymphocyte protein n=1 Tax=Poecilia formosa TaxID=48698 RepID=A0A087XM17_POEFO